MENQLPVMLVCSAQVTSVTWNSTGASLACAFGKLDTPLGCKRAVWREVTGQTASERVCICKFVLAEQLGSHDHSCMSKGGHPSTPKSLTSIPQDSQSHTVRTIPRLGWCEVTAPVCVWNIFRPVCGCSLQLCSIFGPKHPRQEINPSMLPSVGMACRQAPACGR